MICFHLKLRRIIESRQINESKQLQVDIRSIVEPKQLTISSTANKGCKDWRGCRGCVEGVKGETKTNLDASRWIGYLGIMNLEKLSLTKTSSSGHQTHFLVESFINNKHNWESGIEIEAVTKQEKKKGRKSYKRRWVELKTIMQHCKGKMHCRHRKSNAQHRRWRQATLMLQTKKILMQVRKRT
jgi:hypothetical protein